MKVIFWPSTEVGMREKVIDTIHPEPNSGCWLWTGTSHTCNKKTSYGVAILNNKKIGAHRYSYLAFKGKIPEKIFVCHHCDTPLCVNPNHLFLGNTKDNAIDMVKKGRHKGRVGNGGIIGELIHNSKLNAKDVVKIRKLRKSGLTYPEIAKKFNVTFSCIYRVVKRHNWKHVK